MSWNSACRGNWQKCFCFRNQPIGKLVEALYTEIETATGEAYFLVGSMNRMAPHQVDISVPNGGTGFAICPVFDAFKHHL